MDDYNLLNLLLQQKQQAPTQFNMMSEVPGPQMPEAVTSAFQTQEPFPTAEKLAKSPYAEKYMQKAMESIDQQRKGMKEVEAEFSKLNQTPQGPNLAPLLALSDFFGDTKYMKDYESPEALAKKNQKEAAALKLQMQKGYGDISDKELALLRAQMQDQKQNSVDQDMLQLKKELIKSSIARNQGVANLNAPGGARENMFDVALHDKVTKRVSGDKILGQRQTQYQNLSNALAAVQQADLAPVQQIHELQQAIRKNMGIGGSSGVAERTDTYLNSIGMDKAKFMQYLTGNPQDVLSTHPEMMKHLLEVAKIEMENIAEQKDKRLKVLTSGYDNALYNKRPDLREDLNLATQAAGEQFTFDSAEKPAGPEVGAVVKGYKFLGGDAADSKNWEKQ